MNSIHHLLSNQLNSEYLFVANQAPHLRILLLRNHDILQGIKTLELYHGKIDSMIKEDKSYLDVPTIRDVIKEEFNALRNVLTLFATDLGNSSNQAERIC